jgi:Xaa-Pro aminopeptidase
MPGLGGVRIEDMVLVEKQGCRVMTSLPKKLEIL